jgi:Uma2 family endonuclease
MSAPAMIKRFSLAEFEAMIARGAFSTDNQLELFDGYIVDMDAKGPLHECFESRILRRLFEAFLKSPLALELRVECAVALGEGWLVQPDVVLITPFDEVRRITPSDVQLVIEISDTSLGFDLTAKARAYAKSGIPAYWVVDAQGQLTHVHANPIAEAYREVSALSADAMIDIPGTKGLQFCLADCL